jgi:5-methylcytosine-specific restriction endonuclease McrA
MRIDQCHLCKRIIDFGPESEEQYIGYEIHHLIPRSCGGNNEEDNKVLLCHSCHLIMHRQRNGKLKWSYVDEYLTDALIRQKHEQE